VAQVVFEHNAVDTLLRRQWRQTPGGVDFCEKHTAKERRVFGQ
jgi:hypothetical protein